ncbi:MAG: GGDEF domain-containing protein [Desulfuromonadales bacterium]|nr:GGDEF domain-containing protein [Desulfuromonadales bacterium]
MIFTSIKTRMTLAACALVVFLLTATAVFTLSYFRSEFRANIANQQFSLVATLAQGVEDNLASGQAALTAEAAVLPTDAFADAEAAQRFLDNRKGLHALFDNGLFLFSPEGDLIAESPFLPERRRINFAFREYFQTTLATRQPHISLPYRSSRSGNPAVMMTVPVYTLDGGLRGIFAGSLDLLQPNILGQLSQIRIGRTGYLYLYSHDRTMIIHPNPARILQQDVPVGVNRFFDKALEGFEGTGETVNSRGLHALASFKRLNLVPWILAANYPVTEAYAPVKRAQRFFLAGILLGALLSMVLVWLLMKRLTCPLVDFTRHVEGMANLSGEERFFKYGGGDEIDTLAQTFNRMIAENESQTEKLRYLSNHDGLTGLYNRRYFEEELQRLGRGRHAPIAVIMADIDDLKKVNDSMGHAAGDALIRSAAEVLVGAFRAGDVVARIGGDEFAALLPGAGVQEAEQALARIWRRQSELTDPEGLPLSLAIGWAVAESSSELVAALRRADARMYDNKNSRTEKIEA